MLIIDKFIQTVLWEDSPNTFITQVKRQMLGNISSINAVKITFMTIFMAFNVEFNSLVV